jgi:hypothetical protein
MARDNSRVVQALLIIAREIPAVRPDGRELFLGAWRSLLRRLGTAKVSPLLRLARTKHSLPVNGNVYQLNVKSIH